MTTRNVSGFHPMNEKGRHHRRPFSFPHTGGLFEDRYVECYSEVRGNKLTINQEYTYPNKNRQNPKRGIKFRHNHLMKDKIIFWKLMKSLRRESQRLNQEIWHAHLHVLPRLSRPTRTRSRAGYGWGNAFPHRINVNIVSGGS